MMTAIMRGLRMVRIGLPVAVWTTLALVAVFAIAGAAAIAALSFERAAGDHRGSRGHVVVYLAPEIDSARAQAAVAALAGQPGVERVELIEASETRSRLAATLGEPALLDAIDATALPRSIEVELAAGLRDVVGLGTTLREFGSEPGVADVVLEDPQADRIADQLARGRRIAWPVAAGLAVLALLAAIAVLRIGLANHRRQRAISALFGAGPAFTVVPLAMMGAIIALLAATIAGGGLVAVTAWCDVGFDVVVPDASDFVIGFACCAICGLFAGGVAGSSTEARCGALV